MPTRSFKLTERLDRFIEAQVESGHYQDAGEVLRAGLRLLERQTQEEEEKLALLRKLATAGFRSLDQGEGVSLASEADLRNAMAEIGRRSAKAADAEGSD